MRLAVFGGEESLFYETIRDFADGRAFPVMGPPVTGGVAKHPGALFFWILAPGQWLSPTPEMAYACVALLGVASVWLVWDALRRSGFPAAGAFLAGILMAVSPWSVFYADRVWNSNVVGVFVALSFWAAVRVRQCSTTRWVALLVGSALVMPQIHLSAPVVWAALVGLVGFRRLNWRWAAVGVAAAVLVYGPYLASEFSTNFSNARAYVRESGHYPARVPLAVPLYLARFATLDASYFEMSGHSVPVNQRQLIEAPLFGDRVRPFHPLRAAALGLSVVLAAVALAKAVRTPEWWPFGRALAVGLAADMLLVGYSGKVVFPHYVQPLLPFLFAAFATLRPRPLVVTLAVAYCIGAADVGWMVTHHLNARNSLPVQRRVIERLMPERQVQLAIEFQGYLYSYQVLSRLAYDGRLRLGHDGTYYALIETDGTKSPARANAEVEGLGVVMLDAVETIGPVTLYRVSPAASFPPR